jgi:hypothetical protein
MSDIESRNNQEEATYLLRKIAIERGTELLSSHSWVWEFARWKELAFVLFAQIAKVPEKELRRLTNQMETLGLLDVSTLAGLLKENKGIRLSQQLQLRRIAELLRENGFTEEQSNKALITLCEAALALQEQYDGKIQKYLRYYGELMLKDVKKTFNFSAIGDDEAASAFTYWLQNVLGMPLSLVDENVQRFCAQHNLQPGDLIAAADDLGFMDDLAYLHNAKPSANN